MWTLLNSKFILRYTCFPLVLYQKSNTKKFELSNEQHLELAKMVTDAGIGYTSSVWDVDAMSWIDSYIPVYKTGSGDLTAYPAIKNN